MKAKTYLAEQNFALQLRDRASFEEALNEALRAVWKKTYTRFNEKRANAIGPRLHVFGAEARRFITGIVEDDRLWKAIVSGYEAARPLTWKALGYTPVEWDAVSERYRDSVAIQLQSLHYTAFENIVGRSNTSTLQLVSTFPKPYPSYKES